LALSAQSIIASRQNPRFKALRKLADDPARHGLQLLTAYTWLRRASNAV
jgi:hypothetical protein